MPDIAMCGGTDCSKKDECYRHTATPKPMWQTYMNTPDKVGDLCMYFWPNTELESRKTVIIGPRRNNV